MIFEYVRGEEMDCVARGVTCTPQQKGEIRNTLWLDFPSRAAETDNVASPFYFLFLCGTLWLFLVSVTAQMYYYLILKLHCWLAISKIACGVTP